MTIEERLKAFEDANLIERFNYWEQRFDDAMKAREIAHITQKETRKKLKDFDERLKKIEHFTNYLIDYFNPDNKLQDEIKKLKEQLDKKTEELEMTRSILKTALK